MASHSSMKAFAELYHHNATKVHLGKDVANGNGVAASGSVLKWGGMDMQRTTNPTQFLVWHWRAVVRHCCAVLGIWCSIVWHGVM